MSEEGAFKIRMLYEHRTFIDLYYDRENRLTDLGKGIESHPDPLLDSFMALEKIETMLDEARKDIGEGFPKGRIETKTTEETRLLGYILDLRARFLNWFGDAEK